MPVIHGNLEVTSDPRGIDDEGYERTICERMTQSPDRDRRVRITAALPCRVAAKQSILADCPHSFYNRNVVVYSQGCR